MMWPTPIGEILGPLGWGILVGHLNGDVGCNIGESSGVIITGDKNPFEWVAKPTQIHLRLLSM